MPRARLILEWLAILLLTLGIAAWTLLTEATERLDTALLDRALVLDASPASEGILLVTIDDRSLAAEGQWPWDRRKIASLVDRIDQVGARGILLDILYTEPSLPEADNALATSLSRSGKVGLPLGIGPPANRSEGFDPVPPIDILGRAAMVIGHVGITPDNDGPVRRIALKLGDGRAGGAPIEHLALALHRRLEPQRAIEIPEHPNGPAMQLRPAGSYRSVSASAVLAGEVPADFLVGKLVFVGATAQGLGDNFPVSGASGSMMSGAELQANLYQDISDGGFVKDLGSGPALLITVLLIALLFFAFWALRPLWCVAIAMGLGTFSLLFSFALVMATHKWFPPGPSLVGLVIAYPLWGWRRLAAINQYLMGKADKLALVEGAPASASEGFDSVARAVNRLDFLVDEVSERRVFLRRVVESTPDALCVFDSAGQLIMMNQRARSIVGDRADASEGLSVDQLLARFGGRLNEDGSELTLSNGSIFVITRSTGQPEDRWPEIHLAMFTDVTAQRRAESERRQALEFLSHDMRAPQTAILGLTSDRAHEESEAKRLTRIRGHARRTLELADSFIELARMAETPIELGELDLAMLAEEAADRAYPIATEYGATVTVNAPEAPVFVEVDGQLLSRMLDNLVGNALKYGASKVTVDVSEFRAGGRLVIADNGPGLPEVRRADPFARFGFRASGGKGGVGLGLAFVAGAVERHGGAIVCESEAGRGTRFVIDLPNLSGG